MTPKKSPEGEVASVRPSRGKTPARTGKKGPPAKYDWPLIQQEFMEGYQIAGEDEDHRTFPTLKDLALRHGVGYQTIRERAAKERWSEKKQEFQVRATMERQRRRAQVLAKNAVAFDERAYKTADIGVVLIQGRLAEVMQEWQMMKPRREAALQNRLNGIKVDDKDLRSPVYFRELSELASALDRFQQIGMRALGTDVKKVELSGPEGETLTVNVQHELVRDDEERAAGVIAALIDAEQLPADMLAVIKGEDIVDAEVVPDVEEEGDF